MSEYPESGPTRRPVLVPVIIAAVFLTIIGVSVGLALGAVSRDRQVAAARTTPPASTPTARPTPSAAPPAPSSGPSVPPPAGTPSKPPPFTWTPPSKTGDRCRPETQAANRALGGDSGDAFLQLKIRTVAGTVAYICATDSGELYYHGSRDADGDADAVRWDDGKNALFLTGARKSGAGYVVQATEGDGTTTTITVTKREWRMENPEKKTVVEAARAG